MADIYFTSPVSNRQSVKLNLSSMQTWEELLGYDSAGTELSVEKAFAVESWYRRCVMIRARATGDIPFLVKSSRGRTIWDSERAEIPPKGLEPFWNLKSRVVLSSASLALTAVAYMLIERESGRYLGLRWFNPNKVREVFDDRGELIRYRHRVKNDHMEYDPRDVVAVYDMDPFVEAGRGSSDGYASRVNADVLNSLAVWADNYLDKGLVKATLIKAAGPKPPEAEVTRLKAFLSRFLTGKTNAGNVEVVSSDVSFETIGEGMRDLSNVNLTQDQRQAIAAGIGVPYSLVMSSAANFATKKADQLDLYTTTCFSDASLIEAELNNKLFNPMGLYFQFQPRRLEVVQAYELEKAQSVFTVTGKPVLTVNEGRELLGYPPVDGGDEIPATSATPTTPTTPPPNNAPEEEAEEENASGTNALRQRELINYRKKVEKKMGDSKLPKPVRWNPEHISHFDAAVIYERLVAGYDLDTAFEEPFV